MKVNRRLKLLNFSNTIQLSFKPRSGKIYLNHSNKVSGEILSSITNCVIDDFEYRPASRRKLETFISKHFDPLNCSDIRDCHENLKTINESKVERMHRRQLRAILGKN